MPTTREPRPRAIPGTLVGLIALIPLAVAACSSGGTAPADHQAAVAARGAEVMPFDLDATTHVFTRTDDGGLQVVRADDASDRVQVDLIREHLAAERDAFSRGDFSDPARIHGADMPGVAELSAGYRDITVTYAERPDGAELRYRTDDPRLRDAVHAWFDRQLVDHGDHAHDGRDGHQP